MTRSRRTSPQGNSVLAALAARPSAWRHGYDLSRETGLASGTLYPLLIRLHDAGLLEAEWRPSARPGRPARHAYRLTAAGLRAATAAASPVGSADAGPTPAGVFA